MNNFKFLSQFAPSFLINGDDVKILVTPGEFYDKLLEGIKFAKKRIVLSALYLGTGEHELKLINCLNDTLQQRETEDISVDVEILFDFVRGSRGEVNSKTMLLPLVKNYCSAECKTKLTVSFYHTPFLRGIVKKILPDRLNEIIGLNHLKIYIFDDTFIISGANLSTDYFLQRQDRYIFFENCCGLSNYFQSLIKAVSKFSFQLQPTGEVVLSKLCPSHPVTGNFDLYKDFVKECLHEALTLPDSTEVKCHSYFTLNGFYQQVKILFLSPISSIKNLFYCNGISSGSQMLKTFNDDMAHFDTVVYPTFQFGYFGIKQDEIVTTKLLESFPRDSCICFTSGYFNITNSYSSKILESVANFDIVTASPDANGFLNASGFSGNIPAVYSHFTRQFFDKVSSSNKVDNIKIWEYLQPDWTYHAKGLWYCENRMSMPTMTMIGSSNYGLRSVNRDLEAQVTIVTKNRNLMKQLHHEKCNIMKHSRIMSADTFNESRYYVPRWVSFVTTFIKHYF